MVIGLIIESFLRRKEFLVDPSQVPVSTAAISEESELVSRAAVGDRAAFEELYHRYFGRVYSLVSRLVDNAREAEEATQEAFFEIYRCIGRFRGLSQFYTWLFRVAANIAITFSKKQMRIRQLQLPFGDDLKWEAKERVYQAGPEDTAEARDFFRKLDRALRELPPNQRVVVILGPIQGHTYEQMARILEVTVDVVKARLHRARANLRRLLTSRRS